MRSVIKLGLVVLSLLTPIVGQAARAAAVDDYADTVLLSHEQGEALAAFAAQSEKRARSKPDCSHLVHLLYARAGLIYPYEDSRVLYRGVSDFKRVKTPQAGDLAVWLGHVGIVLSPEEKTFLSSVRSGIITESWMAPHWVRRGRPRFYRYRIGPETDMTLLAKVMGDDTRPENGARDSVRNGVNAQLPSSGSPATLVSRREELQLESNEPARQDARSTDESGHDTGSIVATITQRQIPSRQQIVDAIMESSRTHARKLLAGAALDVARPFSVFARIEVEQIKVKHESGWVTLKLSETMCQEEGRILPARTVERELSIVRGSTGVWMITDPREHAYLADEQALQIFESQAELFLRQAPNSSSTRIVVKALDRLYDQQLDTPERAAIR
jgi:NlpC/P60 family